MTDCTITYSAALRLPSILRAHRGVLLPVLALFAFLFLAAAPVWAFETVRTEDSSVSAAISAAGAIAPPEEPVARPAKRIQFGDPCLPMLSNIRPERAPQYMNRNRFGNENTAGFVFGIRFALGSPAKTKPQNDPVQIDVWQPGNRGDSNALAIAGYRHCKTDAALKALMED